MVELWQDRLPGELGDLKTKPRELRHLLHRVRQEETRATGFSRARVNEREGERNTVGSRFSCGASAEAKSVPTRVSQGRWRDELRIRALGTEESGIQPTVVERRQVVQFLIPNSQTQDALKTEKFWCQKNPVLNWCKAVCHLESSLFVWIFVVLL